MKRENAFLIAPGPTPQVHEITCEEIPPVRADQFLDDDPSRPVQLRPRLGWEAGPGRQCKGNRVLVCRTSVPELRAFVKLPVGRRANTPANVEHAIRRVERFDPRIAGLFRAAIRNAPKPAASQNT